MEFLLSLDNAVLKFFSVNLKNPVFDVIMPFITKVNNHGEVWILLSIILMINKNTLARRLGITILIAVAMGYLAGEAGLKNLIGRQRPIGDEYNFNFIIPKPDSYSFPSGHTASSFAAFGVCLFKKVRYRYWVLALASLIAFSRLYLHVHYPSDVLGGIVLGFLCAWVAVNLGNAFFRKRA